MKKLKICFVMPFHIDEGRGGGSEVQAWLLAQELAQRGFSVSYIAQSVNNKQGTKEELNGVKIRWIKYFRRFRWANALKYYKVLKEDNPDIIVQRFTSLITGIIGYYNKRYGKKFVWICNEDSCPQKWSYLKKRIKIIKKNKISKIKSVYFLADAFMNDLIRNWGMKQITFPFTQNIYQKETLKREFGIDSYRMYSGHKKPEFIYSPEYKLSERIVLWAANLGSRKRPEKFIELVKVAKKCDFRFVMIGGTEDKAYEDFLFQKKPHTLEWLGKKSFEETLEWFSRAAFCVNTSNKQGEGFPNTYIQAWFRGVPVLSLEVDPDNIIQDNKLGYVVGDVDSLLQTLEALSKNKEEYSDMSKRAIQYAEEYHSIEKMTDNFLNIILKDVERKITQIAHFDY